MSSTLLLRSLRLLSLLLTFSLCAIGQAPTIQLQSFASGFTRPVDIENCNDNRVFIVEQAGYIRIVNPNGTALPTPFLNIDARVGSNGNEQGLLGLAFHPKYKENGYFYVDYTNNAGNTVISRFNVSANDSNLANANSELILLTIFQPYSNHNGGCVKFGPDGYLYIGMGDGGSAGDPGNRAQNLDSLLGKMLRIDVNNGALYSIPPDNPFINKPNARPEVWSYGMRNPWRYSFDKLNGDLWIADVGQNLWEEVNVQAGGSPGGKNYGWRCYEANHAYNTAGCQPQNTYFAPVFELAHSSGYCSITGGYVYRGAKYSDLFGFYFFTDYCNPMIQVLKRTSSGTYQQYNTISFTGAAVSTFGTDQYGELYVANLTNGQIKKIVSTICSPTAFISSDDTLIVCADSIELSTPYGDSLLYSWATPSGPGSSNSIWVNQDGWCNVTVMNATGCQNTDSVYVMIKGAPPAAAIAGLDTVYCSNLSPADSLTGTPSGGAFTGDGMTGNVFYADSAGNGTHIIKYNFTDANGCISSTFQVIKVNTCVGLSQTDSHDFIITGANPSHGQLDLQIESKYNGQVISTVSDISGRVFLNEKINLVNGIQEIRLPMEKAENGIYFWHLQNGETNVTYRFVWIR